MRSPIAVGARKSNGVPATAATRVGISPASTSVQRLACSVRT
jgi:hypothetical protein